MFNKYLISICLIIFLIGIAGVSAIDADEEIIANENESMIEISDLDEDVVASSTESEEIVNQGNNDVLAVSGSFSDLNQTINGNDGKEITLTQDYKFNSGEDFVRGIEINRAVTIDGQGHTLDANLQGRVFQVTHIGVVFKNIKFVNTNLEIDGPMFYFYGGVITGECRAINCEFSNNYLGGLHSFGLGGALYKSTAINCTFNNNYAAQNGGAMYGGTAINCTFNYCRSVVGGAIHSGKAINCTFNDNYAQNAGGACYESPVINCTFSNNYVTTTQDTGTLGSGGAINGGSAKNCIFIGNSAKQHGGAIFKAPAVNCTFEGNHARMGGAVYESQVTNSTFKDNYATKLSFIPAFGGAMSGGSALNCTFIKNRSEGDAGAVYNADAVKCIFIENTAVNGGAMKGHNAVNSTFINNTASSNGGAMYEGTAGNCTFINNSAVNGGAIYGGKIVLCTFENNVASEEGSDYSGTVKDKLTLSVPTDIIVDYGTEAVLPIDLTFSNYKYAGHNVTMELSKKGVVIGKYNLTSGSSWRRMLNAGVYTANVTYKSDGEIQSAISQITVNGIKTKISAEDINMMITDDMVLIATLTNESNAPLAGYQLIVSKNGANMSFMTNESGQISIDLFGIGSGLNVFVITFLGTESHEESSATVNVNVKKLTSKISAEDINMMITDDRVLIATLTDESNIPLVDYQLIVSKKGINVSYVTNESGQISVDLKDLDGGVNVYAITFSGNEIFDGSTATVNVNVEKLASKISAEDISMMITDDRVLIATLTNGSNVPLAGYQLIVSKKGINVSYVTNESGQISVDLKDLDGGVNVYAITFLGSEIYYGSNATVNVNVEKLSSQIIASQVTAVYRDGKYLIVTLKDGNSTPLTNAKITINLNGASKQLTTNSLGQAKLAVSSMVPKKYTAKITFAGDYYHVASSKNVNVVVKKAKPKITAKNKKFKAKTKTKKYYITLKDNKKRAIKKAKVYLKIKGKTYKAKTNNKGKAVFKIKKLTKKGTYKAKITFKASKYYYKVTKKVKIRIR